MGFALYDLHIPCTKTTSSLLFLERDAVSEAKQIQTACINCGRCVSVCPGHVVPARLATLAEHGDMAGFEKMDGMECCECGCCSYICPAKRPLTQSIKSMRKMGSCRAQEKEIGGGITMEQMYNVSSNPHIRDKMTTSRIMQLVVIALLPTTLFGIWNFGVHALLVVLATVASSVFFEWLYDRLMHKKNTTTDFSAL